MTTPAATRRRRTLLTWFWPVPRRSLIPFWVQSRVGMSSGPRVGRPPRYATISRDQRRGSSALDRGEAVEVPAAAEGVLVTAVSDRRGAAGAAVGADGGGASADSAETAAGADAASRGSGSEDGAGAGATGTELPAPGGIAITSSEAPSSGARARGWGRRRPAQ